ncbi:MAG: hypothetical protein ACXWXV_11230 [Aeromicrobium sp.]
MDSIDVDTRAVNGGAVDLDRFMTRRGDRDRSSEHPDLRPRRVDLASAIRSKPPLELMDVDDDEVIERSDCET